MTATAPHTVPVEGPLDLFQTLRFRTVWCATPWIRQDRSGAWIAERTVDGPGTVWIQHRGDHVAARGFGPGGDRLVEDVPAILGLDDAGPAAVDPKHDVVASLCRTHAGVRLGRARDLFPRLVGAALSQKVTGENSKRAILSIAWRWGEPAPGPHAKLRLMPRPEDVAGKPYWQFHPLGIEQHRAGLVRRIASRAAALNRAVALPHGEQAALLETLRGIGPWTSGVVIATELGDPDALPLRDVHLPNDVAWNLADEPRADDTRMLELLAPYAGQRGRVARMLLLGGRKAPKWGPKSRVRDIRGQ